MTTYSICSGLFAAPCRCCTPLRVYVAPLPCVVNLKMELDSIIDMVGVGGPSAQTSRTDRTGQGSLRASSFIERQMLFPARSLSKVTSTIYSYM